MSGPRQFTVIRKVSGKPPSGDADLMYRGGSLDLAKSAALASVALPDVRQAIIYEDSRDESGTFAFTGASWGWAEIAENGRRTLHSVSEEAERAQARTNAETAARIVALLGHVGLMLHAGGYDLAAQLPGEVTKMVQAGESAGAIERLERIHRELHPGAADPYHEVKP